VFLVLGFLVFRYISKEYSGIYDDENDDILLSGPVRNPFANEDTDDLIIPKRSQDSKGDKGAAREEKYNLEKPEADKEKSIVNEEEEQCRRKLETDDFVKYNRDFDKSPVTLPGHSPFTARCSIKCVTTTSSSNYDADFGTGEGKHVLISMESKVNYPNYDVSVAKKNGYDIVMTTDLNSDVPAGYFSWVEYDVMKPPLPTSKKLNAAAAFISNCGAASFRLQAMEMMIKLGIKIDSFGACLKNKATQLGKLEVLPNYKFYLAFENSIEPDYVTEKYLQGLVSGTVTVVIGAPNIADYEPQIGSVIHIPRLEDVPAAVEKMKTLMEDDKAYDDILQWKYTKPDDKFLALFDMSTAHSYCRLCILLATQIQEKERKEVSRPCSCDYKDGGVTKILRHIYVRERGTFEFKSIFLNDMTISQLYSKVKSTFEELDYTPIWSPERVDFNNSKKNLKIYKIYQYGATQRNALYNSDFDINTDEKLQGILEKNKCPYFEVIFV
jgi:glycoprotein 3-alpha-L-fucosyltransferase